MNISPSGVRFIAGWEKYAPKPYKDQGGKVTWGYGHLQMPGEVAPSFISQPDALTLLEKDLQGFVAIANKNLKVTLNQNQYDAFISILENVGPGVPKVKDGIILLRTGRDSTLLTQINASQFPQAALSFLQWDLVDGLVSQGLLNRRRAESKLFQQAVPPQLAYSPSK